MPPALKTACSKEPEESGTGPAPPGSAPKLPGRVTIWVRGWGVLGMVVWGLGAGCTSHPERAPFLCCNVTCTGNLVRTHKEAPERGDAGWFCARGSMPIEFDQPCTADEAPECDQGGTQSGGENVSPPADGGAT